MTPPANGSPRPRRVLRFAYNWASQICDPVRAARALRGLTWYFADLRAYRKFADAEPLAFWDLQPSLQERHATHELDAHYYYVNAWAMRRIVGRAPSSHIDVASQSILSALLSSVVPVTYVDYRPLRAAVPGLGSVAGSLATLPLRDRSVSSLSCLHVAEHVGLGRYGDELDPSGTRKAAGELARVLAPGGNLFFAVPVGRARLCFNAHRIHDPTEVRHMFAELELVEHSGVDDEGRYHEHIPLDTLQDADYGCGFYWLRRS